MEENFAGGKFRGWKISREENFAGGKFREIPFAVDIIFAGGKFRAKSKFANIAKISSTRKIGVIQYAFGEGGGGHQKAYAVYAFINVDNCERSLRIRMSLGSGFGLG